MLAPIDKLESGGNKIIQIEVTRRCDTWTCSNCTRLLPFRVDDRDMTQKVFREACESLSDWPGVVAVFGGNPCVHPFFDQLCRIMAETIPPERRGLWTNNLRGHGQIVRETFPPGVSTFNLNVHGDLAAADYMQRWLPGVKIWGERASEHGPVMLDRRDFGITDEEWVALRENCDINRNWSAIVMQRDNRPVAYFCEIAGALDGVRGENHGVPVEPGWWRWRMDRFQNQVGQCCDRGCGVPLRQEGHLDAEEVYDVSRSFVPLTVRKKGRVDVLVRGERGRQTHDLTDYQGLRK